MNTKRKAELQRRLSMASVPKPPADLASRIKGDIPASLGTPRPAWYGAPALRIAASVVVVIACAVLAMRILSRAPEFPGNSAISMGGRAAKDLAPKTQPLPSLQPAAGEAPGATGVAPSAAARPAEIAAGGSSTENGPAPRDVEAGASAQRADARALEAPAAPVPAPPPSAAVAESNRVQDFVREPAAAVAQRGESVTITASAPALVTKAERTVQLPASKPGISGGVVGGIVGGLTPEQRQAAREEPSASRDAVIALPPLAVTHAIAPSMFGISTDPAAMEIVRAAVKGGEEPPVVDVEAIVNYFASKADEPPRTMTLQVEGSPPPVLATPRTRIVRISIDTPHSDDDSSVAATDAFLGISFDPEAVAAHRLIGGTATLTPSQRIILKNTSVTALYEIQLRPNVRGRQKVVSASLTYVDGISRRRQALMSVLRVSDIDRVWLDASYRHRLATLGAIWGESLKNARGNGEVARRAAELARQDPKDRKAKELAELASASSRRRSSGSTGSGR